MALKTAKMFKDFILAANDDNTAITLSARDVVDVKVKNDNFANQVTILDKNGTYNFFDYKYITFDGEAVFEITDVIKNGKYNTLFVDYLSNVKFDEEDADFFVQSVSAATLQKLGIDINELLRVLGKNTEQGIENVVTAKNENQTPLIYAIKLRFSECPQNLSDMITPSNPRKSGGITGKNIADANRIAAFNVEYDGDIHSAFFKQFDTAFSALIPVPIMRGSSLAFKNVDTEEITDVSGSNISFKLFISRINALITDLTISAELTLLPLDGLVTFPNSATAVNALSIERIENPATGIYYRYIIPYSENDNGAGAPNAETFGGMLRDIHDETVAGGVVYPIFCLNSYVSSAKFVTTGFAEVRKPTRIYIIGENDSDKIYTSIRILGSEIDLREMRNDYITILRTDNGMRIYQDFSRKIYTDIETSFEFARDAYSNYDAYKKANIELVQRQQNATLEQTQKQERDLQTIQNIFTGINTGKNAITSILNGKPGGAIGAAIDAGLQIAQNEISLNMQQQNERANQKLAQTQELERARATITATSELSGSVSLSNAYSTDGTQNENDVKDTLFSLKYFFVNTAIARANIERFAFENEVLDRVISTSEIILPKWQKLHNFFLASIKNRSPKSTKKSFNAYIYGGAQSQRAARALFSNTTGGELPNVDVGTGFAGNFSNNGGATVTFIFDSTINTRAHLTLYSTGRRQGAQDFQAVWIASYVNGDNPRVFIAANPTIPQGDPNTEWTRSYPLDLGDIPITAGHNEIAITVRVPVVTDGNGNLDKIEIETDAMLIFIDHDNE